MASRYMIHDSEDDSQSARANSQTTTARDTMELDGSECDDDREDDADNDSGDDEDEEGESDQRADDDDDEEEDEEDSSALGSADDLLDDDGDIIPISLGEELLQEKLDNLRYNRLVKQFKDPDGWLPLSDATYEHEGQARSSIAQSISKQTWTMTVDDIVATMHPDVLEAVTKLDGNINALYHNDWKVHDLLEKYKGRCKVKQPVIYVRAVTRGANDNYGRLTLDEAREVAKQAVIYADPDDARWDAAYKIDAKSPAKSWTQQRSKDGERYFLKTSKNRIDPGRQRQLKTFARALDKLADHCRSEGEMHVPVMHYVGYAMSGLSRMKQHDRGGDSSSWLLQFVEATMKAKRWNPHVGHYFVAFISEVQGASIAEVLITRFTRAYYYAGGFNIAQAGASVASIYLRGETPGERRRIRGEALGWIEKKTPYRENQANELRKRVSLQERKFQADQDALYGARDKVKEEVHDAMDVFATKDAQEVMHDLEAIQDQFPEESEVLKEEEIFWKTKFDEMRDAGCM